MFHLISCQPIHGNPPREPFPSRNPYPGQSFGFLRDFWSTINSIFNSSLSHTQRCSAAPQGLIFPGFYRVAVKAHFLSHKFWYQTFLPGSLSCQNDPLDFIFQINSTLSATSSLSLEDLSEISFDGERKQNPFSPKKGQKYPKLSIACLTAT